MKCMIRSSIDVCNVMIIRDDNIIVMILLDKGCEPYSTGNINSDTCRPVVKANPRFHNKLLQKSYENTSIL